MSEFAISTKALTKKYNCYDSPLDRLKEALHPFRKKFHRDFYALREVSMEIAQGETIGVIGKNGSGKSTLLKIITGVLAPTSGSVAVHGKILALLELGAGFSPELTGIENVFFSGAIMGYERKEIEAKLDAIIAFADIGDFVDQPVKNYSSGMYVRLAFAVIANMEAEILIVDEALAVGDALFTQKCMRFLRKFREKGTIFFVSHDIGSVVNLCHRAIWLEEGQVRKQGPAKEVCEAYLATLFNSDPDAMKHEDTQSAPVEPSAATVYVDQRLKFINHSQYRNDIQLFSFDPHQASFGKNGALIEDVRILDADGNTLNWVVGGEPVKLLIRAKALQDIRGAIVGFYVKDKLGQTLFGDNTCITTSTKPVNLRAGERFEAAFEYNMPFLPRGVYSICAALAEGNQEEHVQHHWIHDALVFESHSSFVATGLVGIPMRNITLQAA